jgi:hypothetical protein
MRHELGRADAFHRRQGADEFVFQHAEGLAQVTLRELGDDVVAVSVREFRIRRCVFDNGPTNVLLALNRHPRQRYKIISTSTLPLLS